MKTPSQMNMTPGISPRSKIFSPTGAAVGGVHSGFGSTHQKQNNLAAFFNATDQQPQPRVVPSAVSGAGSTTLPQDGSILEGWIVQEEQRDSATKAWVKQYMVLKAETKSSVDGFSFCLKYASTNSVVDFDSQLKGSIALTRTMLVTKAVVTAVTPKASEEVRTVIQVADPNNTVGLRFTTGSEEEASHWFAAIRKAISESKI